MPHANARLTVHGRRLLVARVKAGHRPAEVGKQIGVSRQTVHKWVARHRAQGDAGLVDRTSRPRTCPGRTPPAVEQRILAARAREHAGPVGLAGILGLPASTIGAVLRRHGVPRLDDIDRVTGQPVRQRASDRRYERSRPGELLHVDVKKLGRIPPGGGWRVHGRTADTTHQQMGWEYLHVAVDDHSRLVYAALLPDEKGPTCAQFLHAACSWFRDHGVTVERVLTDNAKSYRVSRDWAAVCAALGVRRWFIKPRCPWTNGKAERFNRTAQTEWAYARPWDSNEARAQALAPFLHRYNTRRGHTALGGRPPASRLPAPA